MQKRKSKPLFSPVKWGFQIDIQLLMKIEVPGVTKIKS